MSSLPLPPPPPQPEHILDPATGASPAGGKKKRVGAPKAKGAVRAKSGCYTCRIRRKKCDEQADADGNCQTCVRLRLECLGFGPKRPDWMRENNSVQELREKIKQFLASQGMIKGHSGGGVRSTQHDPSVLNLSADNGAHPNVPRNVAPRNQVHHSTQLPPSAVRDGPAHPHDTLMHFPPLPGGPPFPPPPGQAGHVHPPPPLAHRPHHPVVGMPVHLDPELAYMPPAFAQPPAQPPPPPPPPQAVHHPQQQAAAQQQPQQSRPTLSSIPASPWPSAPSLHSSSFGASYNIQDGYYDGQVSEVQQSTEIVPRMPMGPAYHSFENEREARFVLHYMKHVLKIQYLLAETASIQNFIFELGQRSSSARSAMCLLSAVHKRQLSGHFSYPGQTEAMNKDVLYFYDQTQALLASPAGGVYTEGDAMAGLHVVSSFLFQGGAGAWYDYLHVAMQWVDAALRDERFAGPLEAYRHFGASAQFIIRTTMWFDVWSAVTRRSEPRFRGIYRQLFEGEHGYPQLAGGVDMLPVMGCTNETVLAMSETAALASWKDLHNKQGTLSTVQLVERGRQIEEMYLARENDAVLDDTLMTTNDLDMRRRLAANVFRASARVYLHSVLSGCRPNVDEIKYGVGETIGFLKRVPSSKGASRSVVRSVVLSITLCGCMTDDPQQRSFLSSCLMSLAGQDAQVHGNCGEARRLMERVWERRGRGEDTVDWRDVIRELSTEILLLV